MKVVYYLKRIETPNSFIYSHCFFVPDERMIYVKEIVNGVEIFKDFRNPNSLIEAMAIQKGEDPYEDCRIIKGLLIPDFLETKRFEISDFEKGRLFNILNNIREIKCGARTSSNIDEFFSD
ncbi:MAG: hypothetical protein AABX77_00380 [Nanoarchaeota archaeon]